MTSGSAGGKGPGTGGKSWTLHSRQGLLQAQIYEGVEPEKALPGGAGGTEWPWEDSVPGKCPLALGGSLAGMSNSVPQLLFLRSLNISLWRCHHSRGLCGNEVCGMLQGCPCSRVRVCACMCTCECARACACVGAATLIFSAGPAAIPWEDGDWVLSPGRDPWSKGACIGMRRSPVLCHLPSLDLSFLFG